ncbi:uncharacterized protein LOC119162101 isoform X2 [Rhipicephalus microplus]|uniref:uncharacterized protein LOC119162101 isoform X2 n=1 Tax=Rhipicephalus microplus TaxID=6941 RepID=UPI003F6BB632
MLLAIFISVAAGFCIGSGHFFEQDLNNEDQKMCMEPQELSIHYRVHQGNEYQDKLPVDTPITYRCGIGYLPRDIKTWNATCRMNSNGSLYWEIEKYDCRLVSCGHPGDIRWGRLLDAVFVFSKEVRYECNKGYRMIGNAQLYCQTDGTWSGVKPECQIVDCGPLEGIPNGTVTLHSTQYGSTAEFTCDYGFKIIGTSARTCEADGQWTDEYPHCEEILCPPPELPEVNGTTSLGVNLGTQRSGTRFEYICPPNTLLVGSSINVCQETGSWLFDRPICTPNCVVPVDQSAAVLHQTHWWHHHKVEVQPGTRVTQFEERFFVQCKAGYELLHGIDNPHQKPLRCQGGLWDPPGPWCKELNCVVQADHSAAVIRQTDSSGYKVELQPGSQVAHSERIFVVCKSGYEFIDGIGNPLHRPLRCQGGVWQPTGPWCTEQPCKNIRVPGGEPEFLYLLPNDVLNVTCKPYHTLQKKKNGRTPVCRFGRILGDVPTCKPVNCVVQADHSAAVIRQTDSLGYNKVELQPGSQVAHSERIFVECKSGYEFIDGVGNSLHRPLRCQGGVWQPTGPWCTEQPCKNIRVPGGEPEFLYLLPNDVLNVTCKPYHTLQKKKNGRTPVCRLGRIHGDVPTCKPVDRHGPPVTCTLPVRQERFKAHHKYVRILPQQIVPNGTELVFHCEPIGVTILRGSNTSLCLNGKWIPEVPSCYGKEWKEWDDINIYIYAQTYIVPGGEVYVEPNTEVTVDCLSSTPVHFVSETNIQLEHLKLPARQYGQRAKFPLVYGQRADIACKNVKNASKKIRLLGHDLYRCPEITETPYLNVMRKNREVAHISCRHGYRLQGKPRIHCLGQGVWSDPVPTCVPPIGSPKTHPIGPGNHSLVNKTMSTPVVQGSESTAADPLRHSEQGMAAKPVQTTNKHFVEESAAQAFNRNKEPDTKSHHGHNTRYASVSPAEYSSESTESQPPMSLSQTKDALNTTRLEVQEQSSLHELTTNHVTSGDASREISQPALAFISQNESSRPVICDHRTDSSLCSDPANERRPSTRGTGDDRADPAAGGTSELQTTAPERHEKSDLNVYSNYSLNFNARYSNSSHHRSLQEVKPEAPSLPFNEPSSITDRPSVTSSAHVPMQPEDPYEPSSTKVHPSVQRASCTFPQRQNRLKAHHKHIRILPLESVPHGAELMFHCEPVGETIMGGDVPTSRCFDGQWIPSVPHCYGRESSYWDGLYMKFSAEAYTVPGGLVYVEPNVEVLVECWNTKPVELNIKSYGQLRRSGQYVAWAKFTIALNQRAHIVCRKKHYPKSYREIMLLGHHLYKCPEIPKLPYLEVERKNREVYKFTCQEGYRIQGKSQIHCLGQGVWNDHFPTCVPIKKTSSARTTEPEEQNPINELKPTSVGQAQDGCRFSDFYNIVSHGLVLESKGEVAPLNSTFWPFCDSDGYTLVGNYSAVTCLQNGSWHVPPQVKCIEGCANFDTGPNGPMVVGRRSSYALGDSLMFFCSNGTRLQPRVERIICLGRSWSERVVPVCVPELETTKKRRQNKRVLSG